MQAIYSLQQDSKTVTEFYSELKVLWEELEIYMPIPNCTCHSCCSCEVMLNARSNHSLLYAIWFLTGLNENFGMVKSQILLLDPLPSMTKIFSMVLQHEKQSNFGSCDESKVLFNVVDSKKPSYSSNRANSQSSGAKGNRYCTYCHKPNHTINDYFKKHGYPPHMQRTCRSAYHASGDGTESVQDPLEQGESSNSRSSAPSITQEQYDQLMSLLQSSSVNHSLASTSSAKVNSSKSVHHSLTDQQVV
ncbi:retrovirus-related pol polyprotein from transposon TNT 1-94 [Trifolium medium]|uniref:Retrovirus-related pol polyprotein from transposon TNT 1-94 n=1 Tax=Trifolium medium TaxID=97028 RepID=A0A392NV44_9FABA|nr:retrovirus-related pol polyprotein from transposon TNT 1-94 [Trifolium medium]